MKRTILILALSLVGACGSMRPYDQSNTATAKPAEPTQPSQDEQPQPTEETAQPKDSTSPGR